jgi:cysteinyl-tRNA synthetase
MNIKLYNTSTLKKEEFKPLVENEAGIYSCGPTVYWYQHIGNLRTYIFSDILVKTLKFNGLKVKHVMNVTDVGHLTSDADEGEDKMEKAAAKEGKKAEDIADYYFGIFKKDMERLNINEPDIWCKATAHINEQVELIKVLESKGYTYATSDGIYFDSSKYPDYGDLAKIDKDGLIAGMRVDLKEKKSVTDFALWKFSGEASSRQQEWKSPWGMGFPGWHIECSAMSMKYLGERLDIHTGGIDHIPVHHTNEKAQSEAATGKKYVNYWMHGGFLTFKGEKVSKSKGGLYTISELLELKYNPLVYRYFVLTGHYRTQLSFSLENLDGAKNSYERIKNIVSELKDDGNINGKYIQAFTESINDDLDMPGALSVLWGLLRDKDADGKYKTIAKMDEVLSLGLTEKASLKIPAEIAALLEKRKKARAEKNWALADEIRKEIDQRGYIVEDSPSGAAVKEK